MQQQSIFNCFQSTGLLIAGAIAGLGLGLAAYLGQSTPISGLPAYLTLPLYLGGGQLTGLIAVLLLMLCFFLARDDC